MIEADLDGARVAIVHAVLAQAAFVFAAVLTGKIAIFQFFELCVYFLSCIELGGREENQVRVYLSWRFEKHAVIGVSVRVPTHHG